MKINQHFLSQKVLAAETQFSILAFQSIQVYFSFLLVHPSQEKKEAKLKSELKFEI